MIAVSYKNKRELFAPQELSVATLRKRFAIPEQKSLYRQSADDTLQKLTDDNLVEHLEALPAGSAKKATKKTEKSQKKQKKQGKKDRGGKEKTREASADENLESGEASRIVALTDFVLG